MVGSVKLEKIVYKHGDLVFAKVRGYPPWPARIDDTVIPGIKITKKKIPVFFFGTHETGILSPKDLFLFSEYKTTLGAPKLKRQGFHEAMVEIENKPDLTFIPKLKNNEDDSDSNSNDVMPTRKRVRKDSETSQSTTKSKSKTVAKKTSTATSQLNARRRSTRLSRSVKSESEEEDMDVDEISDNESEEAEWKPIRGKRKREIDEKSSVKEKSVPLTLDSSRAVPVTTTNTPKFEESVFQEKEKSNGRIESIKKEDFIEKNDEAVQMNLENGSKDDIVKSSDEKMDIQETPKDVDVSCNTKQNEEEQRDDKENTTSEKDLANNDKEQVSNDKSQETDLINTDKEYLKDHNEGTDAIITNVDSQETLIKNSSIETTVIEVTKVRHPVPLKQQIETGEFIADDNLAGKLQKKLAEKEVEKERKKKEKYAKKKQDKMLLIRTEVKLRYLDMKIKESLSVKGQDIDKCICAMDKLVALPITPLMLKKNPDVVLTIRKCCKFKNSGIVRMKAEYVYNTFKMLFMVPEGQSFWQTFQNETKRLEEAAAKMGKDLGDMTEDINPEPSTEKSDEGLKSSDNKESTKVPIEVEKSNGECFAGGNRVPKVQKEEQREDNEIDTGVRQEEKSEVPNNTLCCTF